MGNQQNQVNMTPEEAKASLGIATFLQDQLMPKTQPEPPQTLESALGEAETPKPDKTSTQRARKAHRRYRG